MLLQLRDVVVTNPYPHLEENLPQVKPWPGVRGIPDYDSGGSDNCQSVRFPVVPTNGTRIVDCACCLAIPLRAGIGIIAASLLLRADEVIEWPQLVHAGCCTC